MFFLKELSFYFAEVLKYSFQLCRRAKQKDVKKLTEEEKFISPVKEKNKNISELFPSIISSIGKGSFETSSVFSNIKDLFNNNMRSSDVFQEKGSLVQRERKIESENNSDKLYCPKCRFEITTIPNSNLVRCYHPLSCKGKTIFCKKCKKILDGISDSERNHFKYGYYTPICENK